MRECLSAIGACAAGVLLIAMAGCGGEPAVASIPKAGGSVAGKSFTAPAVQASNLSTTNPAAAAPQSFFNADLNARRNPFFPNSKQGAENSDLTLGSRLPLISYLKLVGIRPGSARPMALINRTTLCPGEERDVTIVISDEASKAEVRKVSIRCLEIRRDSVLISIAGEEGVKELRMAQGK